MNKVIVKINIALFILFGLIGLFSHNYKNFCTCKSKTNSSMCIFIYDEKGSIKETIKDSLSSVEVKEGEKIKVVVTLKNPGSPKEFCFVCKAHFFFKKIFSCI